MKTPNKSFQRTVKKLHFLPSAEFRRWGQQIPYAHEVSMKIKYLAGCCIAFCFSASVFAACPAEKVAVTKPGYYGALNQGAYGEMDQAVRSNDKASLSSLLAQRSVAEMPAGKKVCILAIDFHGYRKQIELPGLQVPYWVPDEALTEVR